MSVKHCGWQSRIDWWSSGCEDEIETYKIKEYEKQIKSKVTMLVVAVLLSLLSSVNVQASKTGKCGDNITWTLDDIVKI